MSQQPERYVVLQTTSSREQNDMLQVVLPGFRYPARLQPFNITPNYIWLCLSHKLHICSILLSIYLTVSLPSSVVKHFSILL